MTAALLLFWPKSSTRVNTACPSCSIFYETTGAGTVSVRRVLKNPNAPTPVCAACLNIKVTDE